jgi:hypothetical protein
MQASPAVACAGALARAGRTALDLLGDEVAVLSEALGADLGRLNLDELDSVAACVIALGAAPPAAPAWGRREAADGAALVLALVEPDLRAASRAHEAVYERFTEHVWSVPPELLVRSARWWRPVARHRLRQHVRAASRTGAVPGRLSGLARQIVEARVARARLAPLRPLLSHHLGHLDRGVLTDAGSALQAVNAVRDLQGALALLHDDERMERLLLAGAFGAPELQGPARSIRTTLAAWTCDVEVAGGRGALALECNSLEAWADQLERDAGLVLAGLEHIERLQPSVTLRQAVDALVLREQAARTGAADAPRSGTEGSSGSL